MRALALPFVATHRLLYWFARVFGHFLTLVVFVGLAWLAAAERGEKAEFVVAAFGLVVVNRTLNVLANAIQPKAKMQWRVERPPTEAAPLLPQRVAPAVRRHSGASAAAAKRQLPPELRALVG